MARVPHVIPYQGSKRAIADRILEIAGVSGVDTFYEPFAGSAAVTLAAASKGLASGYVIGERLEPLARIWEMVIHEPDRLVEEYAVHWQEQLEDPKSYFFSVRASFNSSQSPSELLYLIARCVKNAIRFNPDGEFNQSADNRRLGMRPEKLLREARAASALLRGKTTVVSGDYRETLRKAGKEDLVYLDPPWRGLTRNPRYAFLLNVEEFFGELNKLNERHVAFILSFDGTCGDRTYMREMPGELGLSWIPIETGRSTQATLLGRYETTIESLYLSPALGERTDGGSRKGNGTGDQLPLFS